jgi:hypothetical protein
MGADRPRSGQVGASAYDLTRKPAEVWGGGGASGPCPEVEFGEYRFDTSRALRAAGGRKPSGRGFLTRSDGGLRRAEGKRPRPDRAGDFSPRLWRSPFGFEGVFPPADRETEGPSGSPALPRRADRPRATGRRTRPARPPPPPVRSPAGRPPLRWGEDKYGAAFNAEDEIGSRFFRALISRGSISDVPRMDARPSPPKLRSSRRRPGARNPSLFERGRGPPPQAVGG